ncbi:MAG: ABC transporter permease [Bacteroidales bacterium]|nr:ABC transporter permease [Bacteroidales bacterium]MCF8405634.1 ABC transporter permease [Bacteroidales bacterium]
MLKNYLTTAMRQLIRQKGFTIINITGLAIGMALAILIYLWVLHELSFDKYNQKAENIYRLVQTQHYASGPLTTVSMPGPIAKDIRDEIPEIINSFRFYNQTVTANYKDKTFTEEILLADPQLFEMLDFVFTSGNPNKALNELNSMVISEEMAEKLFDKKDPIGEIVRINNEWQFKVTAIIEKIPENSSLKFDMCIPFENLEQMGYKLDQYGWNSFYVYVELSASADPVALNSKIKKYLQNKSNAENLESGDTENKADIDLFLFPLSKMHLYSYRDDNGPIQFIYIFSAIAIFILLIACINFMNLATARSAKRAREISIRKSVGADRKNLITQFLGESILISFFALLLALFIVWALLPYFNILVEKELVLNLLNLKFLFLLIGVTLLVGFLAGSYPALYLSAFNPVKTVQSTKGKAKGTFYFRRTLVVFQFVLSVGLIISTIAINRQLDYLYNNKTGMDMLDVMQFTLRGSASEKYDILKNHLLSNPKVKHVTRSNAIPFYIGSNSGGIEWEGKDTEDDIIVGFTFTDTDYIETLGMKMADGRYFSMDIQSDTAAVVINEKAAKAFGLENPVGKWLSWGDSKFNIIGVVKDFNHLPMQMGIDPLTMFYEPNRCRQVFIKINGEDKASISQEIGEIWESNSPEFPFEPKFLKDIYESTYTDEARLIKIIGYFALVAIFISCLGLFALSTYIAEQRTKEIGIRKILGAKTISIVSLVSKEFVIWVIVSNVIAWPITWLALKNWLDDYTYHTKLSADIFALALLISIIIALITVTYQSVASSLKKPVDAIKYE